MKANDYLSLEVQRDFQYVKRILCKYHKISEFLTQFEADNQSTNTEDYPTFIEELKRLEKLSEDGSIKLDTLSEVQINAFFKVDKLGRVATLNILDITQCNQTELACIETLMVIVYWYCAYDYPNNFAKHSGENMSDKEAHDNDLAFIHHAYATLKDLKNLLLFKEQGFTNNTITFNHTEEREIEHGQKKTYILKENQVLVNDPLVLKKLTDVLIEDKLNVIRTIPNQYINSLKIQQYTPEMLTYEFINAEFETVRPLVEKEIKGKRASKKAVFKGMISKLIKQYVKDEGLTFAGKVVDERQAQVISYQLLSMFGFISLDLINSHKDRDARIKYMESLPKWADNPILPNFMEVISKEELIKKYSPS